MNTLTRRPRLIAASSYSDKLKNPRWQRKRLEILKRDDFTCQECGDYESELNVHHVVYRRGKEPWDYPDYCYQTLCVDCHEERQALTDKIVDALRLSIAKVKSRRLITVAQQICAGAMLEIEL